MRAEVEFLMTGGGNAIITVYSRRFKFFGKIVSRRYRGSGTVWRDADTGKRCSTSQEMFLADAWTKAIWEMEDENIKRVTPTPRDTSRFKPGDLICGRSERNRNSIRQIVDVRSTGYGWKDPQYGEFEPNGTKKNYNDSESSYDPELREWVLMGDTEEAARDANR